MFGVGRKLTPNIFQQYYLANNPKKLRLVHF